LWPTGRDVVMYDLGTRDGHPAKIGKQWQVRCVAGCGLVIRLAGHSFGGVG
jgi:hypothetical protein